MGDINTNIREIIAGLTEEDEEEDEEEEEGNVIEGMTMLVVFNSTCTMKYLQNTFLIRVAKMLPSFE